MFRLILLAFFSILLSINFSVIAQTSAVLNFPNAFTPNGDGINDCLIPVANEVSVESISILNLDNNLLYGPYGLSDFFCGLSNDGTQLQEGSYVVSYIYSFASGSPLISESSIFHILSYSAELNCLNYGADTLSFSDEIGFDGMPDIFPTNEVFCTTNSTLDSESQGPEFSISPNPNSGSFNLKFNSGFSAQNSKLKIFSIKGKLLVEQVIDISNLSQIEFHFPELNNGVYIIQIGKEKIQKLLISK